MFVEYVQWTTASLLNEDIGIAVGTRESLFKISQKYKSTRKSAFFDKACK